MANYRMNEEYFSGSQASIFLGDVWIDDILDWQCSIGANATPIYGYGQTFFNHAAQGRVLVQGSFTINFKEPNYIFAALARYQIDPSFNLENQTPEFLKDSSLKELSFEDKRKSLDDFFYQSNNSNNKNFVGPSQIAGPVSNRIITNSRLIELGNSPNSNSDADHNDFAVPLFDIKIGYGAELNADTVGEKIVGIKLIGKGKVISANGEPIKETYRFFARNIV